MESQYVDEFIRVKDIISYLSKKYNLDKRIIESITRYPFIFTKKVVSNPEDENEIRIKYFGEFRLKKRYRGRKKEGIIKRSKSDEQE